jgi:hypothetical protein
LFIGVSLFGQVLADDAHQEKGRDIRQQHGK